MSWPFVFTREATVDGGPLSENEKTLIKALGSKPTLNGFLGDAGTLALDELGLRDVDGAAAEFDRLSRADPVILGSLSKEAIQGVVGKHLNEVRECALAELRSDGGRPWARCP